MQKILLVVNSAPYGNESCFNALRLTLMLLEEHQHEVELKLFLMSDAVVAGLQGQAPNEGYNLQQALEIITGFGAVVKLCKTCTNARGITALPLVDGVEIGTLAELADWTLKADKVLSF
ncbi:DsrE/DsrF/TusD sulfur relay family protein [Testudinibacter aquarius]|uniref:Uncharacterized protein involved in oxidation of intracellular sulfur n=1 Tax=Testudinibacter aquarius TaxID=1524974 RepID=A0A4R3Y4C9_9PAST|nr:DsrE family protein [Testudinibacter aquarius]KAE9527994.1 hypothetical protein A1D24_01885 [Testudinibacter aquarius]TCV86600.1 uncharacterized protein involved in oxidation of intracellular sulfur [Testudinibacter aquarius]TNG91316.1 hypothetical protein FHQ21_08035 [Testudinibacter aquarius]